MQLPDELERVIERQVEGRAATPTAFLEEDEIRQSVESGIADIAAGRYSSVSSVEDERRLRARVMGRLQARLAHDP